MSYVPSKMSYNKLYDRPVDGLEVIEPAHPPAVDDVLLGYEIVDVDVDGHCGVFTKPNPGRMNLGGWLVAGVTFLIFWPLSCLPCCMKCSYDTVQRPVYGKKA